MFEPFNMKPALCKGCGCSCDSCGSGATSSYLDLHQQIAELQQQLSKNRSHIGSLEHQLLDARSTTDFELSRTRDELARLRERYERLLESHKKMQKINHDLEDKLLRQVGHSESEKVSLHQELSSMVGRLVEARSLVTQLDQDNKKYRQDCNIAVQLLQCKPSNFVSHRLNSFPSDLQERLRQMMPKDQLLAAENASLNPPEENRIVRIPIATFPPTAMVYSLQEKPRQSDIEKGGAKTETESANSGLISTSLIAKALNQHKPPRVVPQVFMCVSCRRDTELKDTDCQVDLLTRGTRPVEITTFSHGPHGPYGSDHLSNTLLPSSVISISNQKDVSNLHKCSDIKSQGYFLYSNGGGGGCHVTHPETHNPSRQKCLSSSSETEL